MSSETRSMYDRCGYCHALRCQHVASDHSFEEPYPPAAPPPPEPGMTEERLAAIRRAHAADGHINGHVSELLREIDRLRSSPDEAARLREAAERRLWVEEVVRVWWETWEPKPSHRYGHDFPAFLGERFLTDFDMRELEPRNRYSPVTDAGPRSRPAPAETSR